MRGSTCPSYWRKNKWGQQFLSMLAWKRWILIVNSATVAKPIFNEALGSCLTRSIAFQVLYSLMTKRIAVRSWPSSMPCTRSTRRGLSCRRRRWNTIYNTCQKMTPSMRRRRVSDSLIEYFFPFFSCFYTLTCVQDVKL